MAVESVPSADLRRPRRRLPEPPRPRPVHGVVGEILITAGVVLGLFVVWQFFYTDVQSARTQAAALDNLACRDHVEGGRHQRGGAATPSPRRHPSGWQPSPTNLKVYSPEGAPVIAEPSEATTFATLHVPRWGYDYVKPISEGTDRARVLDPLGIGHYRDTSMPGEVGNFAIAGHRTTYGKPFSDINTLQVGDALVVQTEVGLVRLPRDRPRHREPHLHGRDRARARTSQAWRPPSASITLTSCHPRYSAASATSSGEN